MTPETARAAVETKLAADWAAGPNTAIAWPNVPFTPPTSGSWLKVDWLWANGSVTTKGANRLHTMPAILQLTVFSPKDSGDGAADTLAQSARAIFNGVRLASPNQDVMFGAASGPVRLFEESWRSLVLSFPLKVEETVP